MMRMPGIPARWRRGGFLVASLVVAAATFAGSPSLAGSVHVWRVGTYRGIPGQFRTIQAAVDAARPGDWILVAPGDYHENGSSDSELDRKSTRLNSSHITISSAVFCLKK